MPYGRAHGRKLKKQHLSEPPVLRHLGDARARKPTLQGTPDEECMHRYRQKEKKRRGDRALGPLKAGRGGPLPSEAQQQAHLGLLGRLRQTTPEERIIRGIEMTN